jgi:glycosyltransferase involved in cell wall biosynthesis
VNLAKELNISDFINFHGWLSAGKNLNRLYRKSDIYIIPSYHEGFPRSIWEALANSLPVISTDVGGIPYYLKDKHSAILIKPKDENEIVSAVINLINDSDLRKKIISNGIEIAKDADNSIQNKKIISFFKN